MEAAQSGEAISDIHNYLDTFNKEIQTGDQGPTSDVAQVFVDESGQYFYQNVDGSQQQMVVVSSSDPAEGSEGESGGADGSSVMLTPEEDSLHEEGDSLSQGQVALGEDGTLQVIPSMQQGEANSPVVLNTGDNNQIVTLVPSATNPGEVSYVLIVEQSGDTDKDDTVYDFNEADEGLSYESGEEDDKKMMRIIHKKSQTVTQAHMCNYCNYTSPKRYLLSRHMKSHSEERPHKCSVCERGFKTLASLQNHVNTHTGIKPHRCKYCESTFTTSGELVRHVRYIHTHEKPHKCPDCEYASVELSKLKRHMRCHSGERPYQCPHCTYASPDTFKLKRHLRIHTGEKPYECEICRARFTQSNSLKAHKLIHTGNKPVYACELCPTTCGRKTDLRIHVQKLHTSDKPLKCKKCGKAFPDRYTFKQHNKSHEGEKCFKCDLCPYASTSARHLESHMLVHTEQKPYQCDQCDQAFRQKQLLKRHQNLYHNPEYIPPLPREKTQECPECGKAFRHKGNLIRHMAIHDPDASAQEKAQALKIGRQKRLQLINGQQVEMYTGDVDEDEIMAVEGQDGNQYVVLEVIQLQDGEGHVMMSDGIPVTDGPLDGTGVGGVLSASPLMVPETITGDPIATDSIGSVDGACLVPGSTLLELQHKKPTELKTEVVGSVEAKKEVQKEMETCFGFDDEDEGQQIHLEFGE
ncbi:transcriptional repressor CTCF-like [Portunus trituberculatus]|uniref:transcriptional repressor CTCF-like n=1 Tax=Portunus trituberculatus TaxID=210409 RepID=UPI001E1CBAE2|nr:transcriptional repressor CTCF-like [Portunus trituberculatus]